MKNVQTLLLAIVVATGPITAQAGGLAPAIEEAPIVIEETQTAATSSAPNFVVPLLLLGLIGLAAASKSDSNGGGAKAIVTSE